MEKALRVAVISDTHGVLRPNMLKIAEGCDRIIHAGDLDNQETAERLDAMAPLYMVCGNNDWWWRKGRLETLRFELGGLRFFLIHDRMRIHELPPDTDVVIFGHTHRYTEERIGDVLWLNPGSCGRARFGLPLSMAVMTIQGRRYQIEKIEL
ncbi:MAG: metallophosphoesterase family protein [Lachnospirales bacterium]